MRLCHLLKRKTASIRFLESHKNPAPKLIAIELMQQIQFAQPGFSETSLTGKAYRFQHMMLQHSMLVLRADVQLPALKGEM